MTGGAIFTSPLPWAALKGGPFCWPPAGWTQQAGFGGLDGGASLHERSASRIIIINHSLGGREMVGRRATSSLALQSASWRAFEHNE